ncbi:MAG: polysaccharide (de)acetylase [Planctomycetes bacterium]|nr:polysaccharide (de)acetylase [Planctomycetota bacterium]
MSFHRNLSNIVGWRSPRKIVVIESDDWGSIRMPSTKVFEELTALGVDLTSGEGYRYNRFDSLATVDDLSALFELLASYQGRDGKPPVFTAVSVVANPDFDKIRGCNYQEYYYEPFTETLTRYPGCQGSFDLWKEGIQKGLFVPQFHGREHLNVNEWLRLLQKGHKQIHCAFDRGLWEINLGTDEERVSLQAAFDLVSKDEISYQKSVIMEGLNLFEQLHGYKAKLFVPPNGPFSSCLEEVAAEKGISFMSTAKIHREPPGSGQANKSFRWLGKKNSYGQRYITRNCFFEPSSPGRDWVDSCLNEISIAFRWHKPAVISSHRVNYIGALDPSNRENGLYQLKSLLEAIIRRWPEVEFMSSEQLGEIISEVV